MFSRVVSEPRPILFSSPSTNLSTLSWPKTILATALVAICNDAFAPSSSSQNSLTSPICSPRFENEFLTDCQADKGSSDVESISLDSAVGSALTESCGFPALLSNSSIVIGPSCGLYPSITVLMFSSDSPESIIF